MKIVLTLCEMFLAFCYFWMLFRGSVKINGVEFANVRKGTGARCDGQ